MHVLGSSDRPNSLDYTVLQPRPGSNRIKTTCRPSTLLPSPSFFLPVPSNLLLHWLLSGDGGGDSLLEIQLVMVVLFSHLQPGDASGSVLACANRMEGVVCRRCYWVIYATNSMIRPHLEHSFFIRISKEYTTNSMFRSCLEHSFFIGISNEDRSYGLLMSCSIWNGETCLPVPEKRNRFLHKTLEYLKFSQMLEVKACLHARGETAQERGRAQKAGTSNGRQRSLTTVVR